MARNITEELHKVEEEGFISEAKLKAIYSRMGDEIAKDQGYSDLRGLDAVCRYLVDRYHWLPQQVRNLSVDDLRLLLDGYKKTPRRKK